MSPDELLPQVYNELRTLAAAKMRQEADGHTLDTTTLVNEAWLKLNGESFATKTGFVQAAAVAMRRILVDHAQAKKAEKRGGANARAPLDPDRVMCAKPDSDIMAVDATLAKFAAVDPQAAELVQLRYFAGMSITDAATALGISPRTADRLWVTPSRGCSQNYLRISWRDFPGECANGINNLDPRYDP